MASPSRTVIVPLIGAHDACLPVPLPQTSWPDAMPDAVLDYTADVSPWLTDAGGVAIVGATLATAPSGAGEVTYANLSVTNGLISVTLGPAPPARSYLVRIEATTDNAGIVFEWLIGLNIIPVLQDYNVQPPASYGFGTPLVWPDHVPIVPSEDYSTKLNSSVFYFDGLLTGDAFVPNPPRVIVPSENYSTGLNSSVFYFGGLLQSGFTPDPPPYRPSLRFNDPRNSGLLMFRALPIGPVHPLPPQYSPSQDFSDLRNSSLAYLGGQLIGGFTPH
jgi:hypothetical protein